MYMLIIKVSKTALLCRGTSLIRNSARLGPYSRTMTRALGWWAVSYGRGTALWGNSEYFREGLAACWWRPAHDAAPPPRTLEEVLPPPTLEEVLPPPTLEEVLPPPTLEEVLPPPTLCAGWPLRLLRCLTIQHSTLKTAKTVL